MELIYVRGGDKDAPAIAHRGGMLYGVRDDYTPYAAVYMLDINWHAYDWRDYLAKVTRYQPTMAMAADYEYPSQRRRLYQQLRDLKALDVPRIMVCPKFPGAVAHVPSWCVIAISVPTTYAGFLPTPEEVRGRKLHLLGGHPDQQAYLMRLYAQSEVVSIDANILGLKAELGQFWRKRGGWQAAPKNRFPSLLLAIQSARNIRHYLSQAQHVFRTKRVQRCMYDGLLL